MHVYFRGGPLFRHEHITARQTKTTTKKKKKKKKKRERDNGAR